MKEKKGKYVKCKVCGDPTYRMPSELKKRKIHFCSIICRNEYFSGRKNPLWKGGEKVSHVKYREMVNKRKLENKQRAISLLGGKCKCGYSECIDALTFHHTNPKEKDGDMCKLLSKEWSEQTEKELRKCELLCANCHATHHWKERNHA